MAYGRRAVVFTCAEEAIKRVSRMFAGDTRRITDGAKSVKSNRAVLTCGPQEGDTQLISSEPGLWPCDLKINPDPASGFGGPALAEDDLCLALRL